MLICTVKSDTGRKKCRLVACGNFLDVAVGDCFSPTCNRSDVLSLCLYSLSDPSLDWQSVDIKTAFLQTKIDPKESNRECDGVYLRPPPVSTANSKSKQLPSLQHCWKVLNSIYGLKTAPKDWQKTLTNALRKQGFAPCVLDESILLGVQDEKGDFVIVACYVDDLNIFGGIKAVSSAMKAVQKEFETQGDPISIRNTSRNGDFIMYLAQKFWIDRDKDGQMYLCSNMHKYCLELFVKHQFTELHPSLALSPLHFDETAIVKGELLDKATQKRYRGGVAALQYLCGAHRPDIAAAVNILSTQLASPREGAWNALMKLLSYVLGTAEFEFRIPVGEKWSDLHFVTYCDANYSKSETARTGYILGIQAGEDGYYLPVAWKCMKQKTIALSTTECELSALSRSVRESLSMIHYLQTWIPSYCNFSTFTMYADNKSANLIGTGCASVRKVRHLVLSELFIRAVMMEPHTYNCPARTDIKFVDSANNPADMLTKVLVESVLVSLRRKIFLGPPPTEGVKVNSCSHVTTTQWNPSPGLYNMYKLTEHSVIPYQDYKVLISALKFHHLKMYTEFLYTNDPDHLKVVQAYTH
jgi:hypothetical protein